MQGSECSAMAFEVPYTPREQGHFNVVHDREPWEKCEALENDGNGGLAVTQWFIVPEDFAGGRWSESREDSQER
jgi:hypothetical protein